MADEGEPERDQMPLGYKIVLKVFQAYVTIINWFRPSRDDEK